MVSDHQMRVSDAEREAAATELREHYAAGRLTLEELNERLDKTFAAKTRADLAGLFDDLPETGAPAATDGPRPRYRRRHPVLVLVLFFVLALTLGHAVFWAAVPLLWIGLLVAAVLFATRAVGRTRAGHDR